MTTWSHSIGRTGEFVFSCHCFVFCFCERRLKLIGYEGSSNPHNYSCIIAFLTVTVYDIGGAMESVKVRGVNSGCRLRVDSSSHWVYVPCGEAGVRIFRCQIGRLLPARDPLTCVDDAVSLAVNTSDRLYVCDRASDSVYLVSVSRDTLIMRLDTPPQVRGVTDTLACVCAGEDDPGLL